MAVGEWACTVCTFINEPHDTKCAMCETDRVPAPSTVAQPETDAEEPDTVEFVSLPEVVSLIESSSEVSNIFFSNT